MKTFADHPKAHLWSDRNELKPHQVSYGSARKFWFDCDTCGHSFKTRILQITRMNQWCPYCSGHKLCGNKKCQDCFKLSFASHPNIKLWSEKNKEHNPAEYHLRSEKKFWFKCDKCEHDYHTSILQVTRRDSSNNGCPYCSITHPKFCEDKCQWCFKRSFASHPKAKFWSNKNKLKPYQVGKVVHRKIWFNCDKCAHSFQTMLYNVSSGGWCPYCSHTTLRLCGDQKCKHCFKRSFASHPKAKFWSNKNKLKPRQVALKSHRKFRFDCDKCNHEFITSCAHVSGTKSSKPTWCPFCSGNELCDDKNCLDCFKRSFASHPRAKYWSDKNKLKPRQVFLQSNKKFWFKCNECNFQWLTQACVVTGLGCWCPHCVNKTELKLLKWLQKQPFIKKVKHQYKPKWCSTEYHCIMKGEHKTRRYQYSYDFLVTLQNGKQLIIELDGRQHFEQVSNWETPFHNQIRDAYKERKARQHKLKVICVLQEDVYYDRNDWESNLIHMVR